MRNRSAGHATADWTLILCALVVALGTAVMLSCDAAPTPDGGTGGGSGGGGRTPSPTSSPTPSPTSTPTPTASPTPTPDPGDVGPTPPPALSCANDADCDNGVFCDGAERCDTLTNSCIGGDNPCDPDTEECDEATSACVPIAEAGCVDDSDCEPDEICDFDSGQCVPDVLASCVAGSGPCNIGNSSPGCENIACCEDVCVLLGRVECCLQSWTDSCASLTLTQSTCLNP